MQPQHGQFPLPGEVELGRRSPSPLPLSRPWERGFRSVLASFQDAAHHPLQVGFYLLVAHPQHPVAIVSHPLAALFITFLLTEVYGAVDFDHQAARCAIEVSDVWPNRMLPAKLKTAQMPAAQPHPQDLLGGCHPLSQLLGALAGFVEALYAWHISISCLNYRADL
jgi:hypothetical protein